MPKKRGLVSLAYSDSENDDEDNESIDDSGSDHSDVTNNDATKANNGEAVAGESGTTEKFFEDVYGDMDISLKEFQESLYQKSLDEIVIPPPTKRKCSDEVQQKIEEVYEKVKRGFDLNKSIQQRKSMRNPSIYEKMISFCQIDEKASNYPTNIYDPTPFFGPLSYYEELSRLQKEEMEKKEKRRKRRKKSGSLVHPNWLA